MSINMTLAEIQGLSEQDISKIKQIHETIDLFIPFAIEKDYPVAYVRDVLTTYEFDLQKLWRFPQDETKHNRFKLYEFKKQWVYRKFRCLGTGVQFVVPISVKECDFFPIGNGFLDVGRLNGYSRMSGIEEVG